MQPSTQPAGQGSVRPQAPCRQAAWWCRSCGSESLVARGYCRRCYDRHRHSLARFGGYRGSVLTRDGCCQICAALENLIVHHRQPGKNRPGAQITLCRACHVPVHHRHRLPGEYSDLFLRLWQEQHPRWPVQLRLPLSAS